MGNILPSPLPSQSEVEKCYIEIEFTKTPNYFHVDETLLGLKKAHKQLYLTIPENCVIVLRRKWSEYYMTCRAVLVRHMQRSHHVNLTEEDIVLADFNEEVFTRVKVDAQKKLQYGGKARL